MSYRKIEFINQDATPKEISIEVSTDSVKPVLTWYGAYFAGDEYVVQIDGVQVTIDKNGELVGDLP